MLLKGVARKVYGQYVGAVELHGVIQVGLRHSIVQHCITDSLFSDRCGLRSEMHIVNDLNAGRIIVFYVALNIPLIEVVTVEGKEGRSTENMSPGENISLDLTNIS